MDQVLALRPFVPARDFAASKRFYAALGFHPTQEDEHVAILKQDGFSFILQNRYVREAAENQVVHLLVRDVSAWWRRVESASLPEAFGVKSPRPPARQPWGLVVGFIHDPSGVLWHVAGAPF